MKLSLLAVLCLPVCAFADGGLPSQPYIYVAGTGKIQRDPDMVTLSFKVGFRDRDQAVAAKKTQAQAAAVLALLDAEKIARKDVVADSVSLNTMMDESLGSPEKHSVAKGHHVTRDFSVVVRDINAFPKIVDELLALDLEEFEGIEAGYSKQEELIEQVREKAMADAREQAERELKGEQMKIDTIFTISSIPLPQIKDEIFQGPSGEQAAVFPAFGNNKPEKFNPSQYRLAPISVTQTIHVIYLISPVK